MNKHCFVYYQFCSSLSLPSAASAAKNLKDLSSVALVGVSEIHDYVISLKISLSMVEEFFKICPVITE